MEAPTKAELKDRIAELERNSKGWRDLYEQSSFNKCQAIIELEAQAKRATLAAYALLATLFILVGVEVIW